MVYQVRIENFEGPVDLLIHLIEKEQMDISTISIYLVIDEYLNYIRRNVICVNEGSCFLYMASVLMYIKSIYLLPSYQEKVIQEDEDLQEIEERLIEYKKIKEAQKKLEQQYESFQRCYKRGDQMELNFKEDINYRVNVYQLAKFFSVLMNKKNFVDKVENMPEDPVTTEEKISDLRDMFSRQKKMILENILLTSQSRSDLVCLFLAILELIKQQFLTIYYSSDKVEITSLSSVWIVKKDKVG